MGRRIPAYPTTCQQSKLHTPHAFVKLLSVYAHAQPPQPPHACTKTTWRQAAPREDGALQVRIPQVGLVQHSAVHQHVAQVGVLRGAEGQRPSRISGPQGSAPARTQQRVVWSSGTAACCRQHCRARAGGPRLKVGARHHRLDEVAALQVGVLEVAQPAVGCREVGPAQVLHMRTAPSGTRMTKCHGHGVQEASRPARRDSGAREASAAHLVVEVLACDAGLRGLMRSDDCPAAHV